MKQLKKTFFILLAIFVVQSCGVRVNYNLSGGNVGTAKTFQVPLFQNYSSQSAGSTFEPGLDQDFTRSLQDLINNQTSLDYVPSNGDLVYEGEIVEYRISPMTATANQTAAQNRLTIAVNVRFTNNTKEDATFEQRFSFFFDYPANSLLQSVKTQAHEEIFERINQDIFSKSLGDW